MGNCLSCYSSGKKGKNSQVQEEQNVSISLSQAEANINQKKQIIDEKTINRNEDLIKRRRNEFIDNFFQKCNTLNAIEKRNSIFITYLNKKMEITNDVIIVEEDLILKANLDSPNSYYNSFWIILDGKGNDLISKEIFIDNIKVDSSKFEVRNYSIKLEFENIYNNQTRKIRINQKIKNQFDNYNSQHLILQNQGIATKFLIYPDDDLNLDDITNKNYVINKELNLAYFEGITTAETENIHGYINYSKKINYKIYKYIPELSETILQNIIRNKEKDNQPNLNYLAKYKKVVITDYGQDIDEINFMKVSNYKSGQYITSFSIGLYKDVKNQIDSVELNGKPYAYKNNIDNIEFNNIKCYNNQYIEVHLKYKYFTNETKDIYRQENVLISNIKGTYCKCFVQIPDNYIIISTKDILQNIPELKNTYFYKGISNEDKISEMFKFCFEKARWEIDYEYILESQNNIEKCEFILNKIFKGGNLKEIQYDINHEANLTEDRDKFIFKYNNLNKNKTRIIFHIKVENSASNFNFQENNEYLTQIPAEDLQFFKSLVNKILTSDKTNYPDYKKIGKWVHDNIKYNLALTGEKISAKDILNIKQGVCEHFTILYNTLLTAYGIDAIKVSGYAKDITENNIKVKKRKDDINLNEEPSERHAWTLAKIDNEWVPLDATWDLFEKNVPVTHIFQNYGDGGEKIVYNSNNVVQFKRTIESIKYIKS